jgi:hypothetical protein
MFLAYMGRIALALALLAGGAAAHSQTPAGQSASQFPQLPLKREPSAAGAAPEALAWTAVLLLAAAGLGVVIVKRKTGAWPGGAQRCLRRGDSAAGIKPLSRTALTPQASLHVIEWHGEELLLGCTPGSVTVLARHPGQAGTEHPGTQV